MDTPILLLWAALTQMAADYMIWQVTYGNGALTGTTRITTGTRQGGVHPAQVREKAALCAAVHGITAMQIPSAYHTGSTAIQLMRGSSWDSAAQEMSDDVLRMLKNPPNPLYKGECHFPPCKGG